MKYDFSTVKDCAIVADRLGKIAACFGSGQKTELFDSLCKDIGAARVRRLLAALIMQGNGHGVSVEVWDWAARRAYDKDATTLLFRYAIATVKPTAAADIVKDCVKRRRRGRGKH